MRVLFAGTPEVALPSLDAVLASRHQVVAALTRPDAPAGRGRRLVASPVAERATQAGIEVLKPSTVKDPEFLVRLQEIAPDCCPVVAYGGLIPQPVLDAVPHGWVNLHFSLLPAWRGAAPVQHAVLAGDEVSGATTFRLVKELDAGPVFGVLTEAIRPTDTSGDLLSRLADAGAELLVRTLDGIEDGTVEAREQRDDGVSFAPKIDVRDAMIDWAATAQRIDRLVRACTPAPGAWTLFRDERLKVARASLRPDITHLGPGELASAKREVLVGTASHAVQLTQVQPHGRKPMPGPDWARGARVGPGENLAAVAETGSV